MTTTPSWLPFSSPELPGPVSRRRLSRRTSPRAQPPAAKRTRAQPPAAVEAKMAGSLKSCP